jgi:hypothetical protein
MSKTKSVFEIFAVIILVGCTLFLRTTFAGIPEPGMILYGKVVDNQGGLVTAGELTWIYTAAGGADPVTVTTELRQIAGPGGPFSYRVLIPFEREIPGYPASANTIPVPPTPVQYTRIAMVTGTDISMSDMVSLSKAARGTVELITLSAGSLEDADGDGLPDTLEQKICDADPDDDLNTVDDVKPEGDFDGDGESNWTEYSNNTDPTNPLSARAGDVDGDKAVSLADAILALQVMCGAEVSVEVSTFGDVNGDAKIGHEEALHITRRVSEAP